MVVKFEFGPAIEAWLRVAYPRGCWSLRGIRGHQARLYVTNYDKPGRCFDCNVLWWTLFAPCWLVSAPFYKVRDGRPENTSGYNGSNFSYSEYMHGNSLRN